VEAYLEEEDRHLVRINLIPLVEIIMEWVARQPNSEALEEACNNNNKEEDCLEVIKIFSNHFSCFF